MPLSRRALFSAGLAGMIGARPVSPEVIRTAPLPEPTAADWAALAAGLDGSLERPGSASYDEARKLFSPRFDGIRPAAVVRCAGPPDVVEAMGFAARTGLPVVPRGGGHSYVGASTTDAGIVLDLRSMRTVRYDAATATATIGGGTSLLDVYTALGEHGVSIPAGSCGGIGISGLTSGGGIGPVASAHGLTCDNVVSAEVVTPDGKHRTVDAAREAELFWALRGGGGGRFGVVTSWRIRTHPAGTTGAYQLTYDWADAAAVAAGWQARILAAPDHSWSVCRFVTDAAGTLSVRIGGFVLDGDVPAEVAALTRAIGREPTATTSESKPHAQLLRARAAGAARGTHVIGSEIFPAVVPAAGVDALLAVMRARAASRRPGSAELKRMTGAPARVAADATAFPWHGASSMLQWLVDLPAAEPASVTDGYAWIESGHRAMAPWSSGRYLNYLEPGPTDPVRYHGAHLDRLRRLQASTDPSGLFRVPYAL